MALRAISDKPGQRWPGFFMGAVFVASLLLVQAAPAQTQRTSEYLLQMDADHDGRVSLLEYQDWLSYAFDGMDRNHDGVLSIDELPGGKGKPLTRDEHRARLAATFAKQDGNHDGYLNARELASPPQ